MSLREAMKVARHARRPDVPAARWRLHVRVFGQPGGAPLVLVPGLGMSSLYLIPAAVRLADRFEVWGPDFPGFGATPGPRQPLAVPGLADVLASFLGEAGLAPACLLANSLGCQIALDVAARYPDNVDRLVLIGPTVDRARRTARQQLLRIAVDAFRERPSLVALAAFDYARAGPRRAWRTMYHALDDRIEDRLGAVPHPTLVIRGSRDPLVSQAWAETVAEGLPLGRLAVIPGAPHAPNFSDPDAVAARICAFLDQTAVAPDSRTRDSS